MRSLLLDVISSLHVYSDVKRANWKLYGLVHLVHVVRTESCVLTLYNRLINEALTPQAKLFSSVRNVVLAGISLDCGAGAATNFHYLV